MNLHLKHPIQKEVGEGQGRGWEVVRILLFTLFSGGVGSLVFLLLLLFFFRSEPDLILSN